MFVYLFFLCIRFVCGSRDLKGVLLASPAQVSLRLSDDNVGYILPPDVTEALIPHKPKGQGSTGSDIALPYLPLGGVGGKKLEVSSFIARYAARK